MKYIHRFRNPSFINKKIPAVEFSYDNTITSGLAWITGVNIQDVIDDTAQELETKASLSSTVQAIVAGSLTSYDLDVVRESDGANIIQYREELDPDALWIGDNRPGVKIYPIEYTTSGTDVNLDSPDLDDNVAHSNHYKVIDNSIGSWLLTIGDAKWYSNGAVDSTTGWIWSFLGVPANYGPIYFACDGGVWQDFSSTSSGIKLLYLSKSVSYDDEGGYVSYYYDQTAWTYAFNGNSSEIRIAQNGSVYKGSIADANLVVNWEGLTGPAGAAVPDITEDTVSEGNINVVIRGNVFVSGTTTTVNAQELNVENNEIVLNSGLGPLDTPTLDAYMRVNRGNQPDPLFGWDEVNDRFTFIYNGLEIAYITTTGALWTDGNITSDTGIVNGVNISTLNSTASSNQTRITNIEEDRDADPYVNGTDGDLNSPVGTYTTPGSQVFTPMLDDNGTPGGKFHVGTNTWTMDTLGIESWLGDSSGSYGAVKFTVNAGTNWASFADASNNGFKSADLPKTGNGDSSGGTVYYMYDYHAWKAAFEGNNSEVHIAINGDVFKDSIAPQNLVIDHDGNLGPISVSALSDTSATGIADNASGIAVNVADIAAINAELDVNDAQPKRFEVTDLPGYGIPATVTVNDADEDINAILCPFIGFGDRFVVYVSSANWTSPVSTSAGDISTLTNHVSNPASITGPVTLRTSAGLSWRNTIGSYVDLTPGFHTLRFPGTGSNSVRYWYDRDKCFEKLNNKLVIIYIDQAGCLWAGDPTSGGEFICGPTYEEGHGTDLRNLGISDQGVSFNITAPSFVLNSNSSAMITDGNENDLYFEATSVGASVTWDATNTNVVTNDTGLHLLKDGGATWETFADIDTGLYTIQFKTKDINLNVIDGSKLLVYYDKDKWQKAFQGVSIAIYFDQLGGVWAGDPQSGGTYVCGPYDDPYFSEALDHLEDIETVAYVNGYDKNIKYPSGSYNTDANAFTPMLDDNGTPGGKFSVGSNVWTMDTIGTDTWLTSAGSTTYGTVKFSKNAGTNWASFADATNNGFKTVNLPHAATGDTLGGSVSFYYHYIAWRTAFEFGGSDVIIAQNGDVFKGSIATANLVVDHKGHIGPAGDPFTSNHMGTDPKDLGNKNSATTINWNEANVQELTLTGNVALTFAKARPGFAYLLKVTQDGTGSHVLTLPSGYHAESKTLLSLSTGANEVDWFTIVYDGTNYVISVMNNVGTAV